MDSELITLNELLENAMDGLDSLQNYYLEQLEFISSKIENNVGKYVIGVALERYFNK